MSVQSWSTFFAMGGHGLYVWGSVLAVLLAVAAEVFALRSRRQAILASLKEQA